MILSRQLWERSGHWDHYQENMYFLKIDEEDYAVKPMNCPGAIIVYKTRPHSYREFPIRYGELGLVHRHERSGVLHGLMRVRCFTQDDAHIFMLPEQITAEIIKVIDLIDHIYKTFGFSYRMELSTKPDNAMGSDEIWDLATNALKHRLRVVKYRGSTHGTNDYPFLIDEHGISVLPVTSVELKHPALREFISSGVPGVDQMLDGKGFYRGSSILISGTSGTGKTSFGAHFVKATVERGEKALVFAFEESQNQWVRNMASIGLRLDDPIRKGLLRHEASRPTTFGLEMHLVRMHKIVEEFRPDVVVVDPISALIHAGTIEQITGTLLRLVDYFKSRKITALLTTLVGGTRLEHTDLAISSLVDTWMFLRDTELGGERNRGIYVLKARGMAHSNQIREFSITRKGIVLRDAYLGPEGVLTGSARLVDACLDAFGGFDHNAQTLRVVTALERRYPDFDGLNLTWETLEGLVKHNGPLTDRGGAPLERYRARGVPATILDYAKLQDLQFWSFAGVEAQIAAVADDIAYDAHDIDDGLRAGLFGLDDIAAVPLPGKIIGEIRAAHPGLDDHRLVARIDPATDRFAHRRCRRRNQPPARAAGAALGRRGAARRRRRSRASRPRPARRIAPSKAFSRRTCTGTTRVMRVMDQAAGVVRDLFARYSAEPSDLPAEWQEGLAGLDEASRARRIADFIAGMTDRYALAEHERLFDLTPELR